MRLNQLIGGCLFYVAVTLGVVSASVADECCVKYGSSECATVTSGAPCPTGYNTRVSNATCYADYHGIKDLCVIGTNRTSFFGEAGGGYVLTVVDTVALTLITYGGQSAALVSEGLRDLINSDPYLASLGITATSSGGDLIVNGVASLGVKICDPTLNPANLLPTLSQWVLIILALSVGGFFVWQLMRKRKAAVSA